MSEKEKQMVENQGEKASESQVQKKQKTAKKPAPKSLEITNENGEKVKVTETEIIKLMADFAELNDRYLRVLAEYDNYRKRTQKEKEALGLEVKSDTIEAILPVFDNLERAMAFGEADPQSVREGISMVWKQVMDCMQKLGVSEVNPLGQPFNPELHNAVAHVEDENFGENCVAEVFQKGYIIGDRVIRHAMVKVAN